MDGLDCNSIKLYLYFSLCLLVMLQNTVPAHQVSTHTLEPIEGVGFLFKPVT